jgi:hypothetical protein
MAIKPDPFLNDLILAFARSEKSEDAINKIAGEVRFIKENANEMGLWAYGGSAPANRELTPKFQFQVNNLKPLIDCLKYSTAALSYAMVAYDLFAKMPSSSISPDGRLGGKGYIMKIQDIRKNFMNIVEALSSMTDTIYDEVQAPHWAAQTREMDPEIKEELNAALEETEKIRTDPENWAMEQLDGISAQPAVSQAVDGVPEPSASVPLVRGIKRPEIVDPRVKGTAPVNKTPSVKTQGPVNNTEESEWVGDMGGDLDNQDEDFDKMISEVKNQNKPQAQKKVTQPTPKQEQKPEQKAVQKSPPSPQKPKAEKAKAPPKPVPPQPKEEDSSEEEDWLSEAKAPAKPVKKNAPPKPSQDSEEEDWMNEPAPAKTDKKPKPAKVGPPPPSSRTFEDWMDNAEVSDKPAKPKVTEEDDWLAEPISDPNEVSFENTEVSPASGEDGGDEDDWLNSPSETNPDDQNEEEDWLAPVVPTGNNPSPVQKTASKKGLKNQDWKKYMTRN